MGRRVISSSRLSEASALLLSLVIAVLAGASTSLAETRSYQVKSVAMPALPVVGSAQLVLLSATHSDTELQLRVGVFNTGSEPLVTALPIRSSAITLTRYQGGKRSEQSPSTITLDTVTPGEGLASRTMHTGLMVFRLFDQTDSLGSMELRVPYFQALYFALDEVKRFQPIDWSAAQGVSVLDYDLAASTEAFAIVPIRVKSMEVKAEALEFALSFRNASRFPITWKRGGISGRDALLVTDHGELLRPSEVSPAFKPEITAAGAQWAAGEEHSGWVRFPLPHPHAVSELRLVVPGYPSVALRRDEQSGRWETAVRAVTPSEASSKVDAVLDEEKRFTEIQAYWSHFTSLVRKRSYESLLQELRGDARKTMKAALGSWESIPFSSIEYVLPPQQKLTPGSDGVVRKVKVDIRYNLATLPRENTFLSRMDCDMRRLEDGGWVVEFIDYTAHPPFWLLGYSHIEQSEHFIVFHRNLEDSEKPNALALKQLEKAYSRLTKTGLPLSPRYAAFIVAVGDDFEKLTQRNAVTYSGAASSAYTTRDGKISVNNQALYINDYRFYALQRLWGKQDRQVTIHHELVHLALSGLTRPWTPPWLVEGIAMYYADQCDSFSRASLRENLTATTSLVNLSKITHLGADTENPRRVSAQYLLSGEAVLWLEKKYGEESLLKLYSAFARETPHEWLTYQGEPNSELLAAAQLRITKRVFSEVFDGLTLEQLDTFVRLAVGR